MQVVKVKVCEFINVHVRQFWLEQGALVDIEYESNLHFMLYIYSGKFNLEIALCEDHSHYASNSMRNIIDSNRDIILLS